MKTRTAPFAGTAACAVVSVLALLLGLMAAVAAPARAQQSNHPTGLRAVAVTDTTVTLNWTASPRPADVGHYQVVVGGGFEVGTTTGTDFTVTHLNVDTAYTFAVVAVSPDWRWPSEHIPVRTTGTVPPMPAHPVRMGVFAEKGSHQRDFHVKNLLTSGTAGELTHLTYGYGTVTDGRCGIDDTYAALERTQPAETSVDGKADTWDQPVRGYLNQLRELKQTRPGLKILWSFGGPERAHAWTGARQDPAAFAASCARLVDDPRWAGLFDGVDLAMEFPECRTAPCDLGGAAAVTPLTRALRAALGPDRLVTVTLGSRGGGADLYGRADLPGAAAYADWFNVKTYDYYWSTDAQWRYRTAPHAPLYAWDFDEWARDIHYDIRSLTAQGVHPNKLVLGVPTHAWGWEGVRAGPWEGSLHATGPAPGPYESGQDDYRSIRSRCADTGELGQTAYSHCGSQFWTYDTPATVAKKMTYARQYGLGGAFLSNLRGDTADGDLSAAVDRALGGPVR
ncbi:glycosyl hydrolase family 18 protein [Streptomyces sp. NPDC004609]|uniref:glycosyl hydrolase family 18 protein n=1 Tax=Streptomyces sp. NPDC004609 TaxID=3364704 RepID=UPI0036ACF35F